MKKTNWIYWITTGLFSAMMLGSAIAYLTAPAMAERFAQLGFPDYFRIELAIFKLLGVAALVLPMVRGNYKEWAYAGFGIVVISALIAHIAVGDGPETWGFTLVSLGILAASYWAWHKLHPVATA